MVNYSDNNPKKITVWLPLLFALVMIIGMIIGMRLQRVPLIQKINNAELSSASTPSNQGRLEEIVRYIEARYVDEVDREEIIDNAIEELLTQLDPHSNYISKQQLADVNDQLEGSFDGIGIEFMILEDTIRVVSPLSGGPSEAAGVMAGDKLVQVEDSIIAGVGIQNRDIVKLLRGKKGSKVNVGILRGDDPEVKKFTIIRDKIPLNSVDVSYMLDEQTGYIKVSRFSSTTYQEFMQGIEKMVEKEGMKDLVIDLRQNPGGYLQEATKMLSQFFKDRDKLLVYTEGRSVRRSEYESTGKSFYDIGKVAVLIDEGSASASEIVAGAIQDWDRGVVIGRRSFGKGLVQEQYDLKDGSALRLTVARYYTPSGRLIQKPYSDLDSYDNDVYDRYNSGELLSKDSISQSDTSKFYTSKGRVVYAGGGVTPDVFVPIDTIVLNDSYIKLRQWIPHFTFKYLEDNPIGSEFTLEQFSTGFEPDQQLLDAFLKYAKEKGVDVKRSDWLQVKDPVSHMIKARMARKLFQDEGFYRILNQSDESVKKALNAFKKRNVLAEE